MAERLRVLFVSKWMDVGGAERFVSTVLHHLDRERFEPRLVLMRERLGYPIPEDVSYRVLSPAAEHHAFQLPGMILRLAREIDAQRPDLVLSAYAYPSFLVGAALGLARARPRWIARIGTHPRRSEESGLQGWILGRLYRRARLFVANSRALGREFERVHAFARGRVAFQPNATDFERLDRLADAEPHAPLPPRPRLLTAARLDPAKRIDRLLEAFARLPVDLGAQLLLCGEGPLREALGEHARRLGVAERVHFLGHLGNPFSWMARADLFVLSSDHEGSPNALIEAQGLGVPAVSTDCPFGPSEIIEPGRTGWLVPLGEIEPLAAALTGALRDPARLERMRPAARRRTRELFGARAACETLARHLEQVAR